MTRYHPMARESVGRLVDHHRALPEPLRGLQGHMGKCTGPHNLCGLSVAGASSLSVTCNRHRGSIPEHEAEAEL